MKNLYSKINLPKLDIDLNQVKGEYHTHYGRHPKITYYSIKDTDYLNSLLDQPICKIPPSTVFYSDILGAGKLWPHKDHNVSCCINLYFESNNSITYFYKEKEKSEGPWKYPGKESSNIYEFEHIECLGNFKADNHEAYLLNVSEIHSVTMPPPGIRRFITWQWRPSEASYQDVLENLNYSVF